MFNLTYAFIGLLIGFFAGMTLASSGQDSKEESLGCGCVLVVAAVGFIGFSATFGLGWAGAAFAELGIGMLVGSQFGKK
jgi:hypothetical protein